MDELWLDSNYIEIVAILCLPFDKFGAGLIESKLWLDYNYYYCGYVFRVRLWLELVSIVATVSLYFGFIGAGVVPRL